MGPPPPAPSRAGVAVVAFLSVAALAALALADPSTTPLFPSCPFRLATGFLCPVCGAGRAVHALLHGELVRALRFNPLAVVALPFLLAALAARLVRPARPLPRLPRAAGFALLALLLATLVLRNLFPALAPP